MYAQNEVVLVTCGVRFVGKDFFVLALVEHAILRVCGGNGLFHHFRFVGILPAAVMIKRFLPVRFSVFVDFLKQFVSISYFSPFYEKKVTDW